MTGGFPLVGGGRRVAKEQTPAERIKRADSIRWLAAAHFGSHALGCVFCRNALNLPKIARIPQC
jgi:hypothetical protein